jgi:hypothetical protein
VTVNAVPLTPTLIFCVVVGAMLLAAKFIVIAALLDPVTAGLLLTTRIR